ncbi:transposase domain-containing protein, partial [Erysipelotrichaceae bacterium RD49]|nr:transposase domain-containing protein [Erysipelotrichaceae bacterium RD49]
DDGRYEVSNLRDERLVKVLVLYRKNSLFAFSEAGAERLSGYMTLMATARLNGVDPERYLSWVLNQLKDGPAYPTQSDLIDLLPYSGKIPKEIRVK